MKAQRRKTLKPKIYFSSKSDPDYRRASMDYYLSHVIPDYPNVEPDYGTIRDHYLKQLVYIKKVETGWTILPGQIRTFSRDADRNVIAAIKEFGVDAIRLSPEDEAKMRAERAEYQFLEITDLLGIAICKVIRYWRDLALTSNQAAKKRGEDCLKKVSRALIPETRGKKTLLGGPGVVKGVYYGILFDLYQIEHYLRSSAGPRNHSLKIKTAGQNFNFSVDDIREIFQLDEKDRPKPSRPLSLRSYARIVTGRRLRLTEQAVSNYLATKL